MQRTVLWASSSRGWFLLVWRRLSYWIHVGAVMGGVAGGAPGGNGTISAKTVTQMETWGGTGGVVGERCRDSWRCEEQRAG